MQPQDESPREEDRGAGSLFQTIRRRRLTDPLPPLADSGDDAVRNEGGASDQKFGDYRPAGDLWPDQYQFFRAIETHATEALVALKADVLPPFAAARRQGAAEPLYEPAAWAALWRWAEKYRLVEAGDVELLNTPHAIDIARAMDRDPMSRWMPVDIEPFTQDSTAVFFGLGALARVASRTLRAWSDADDLTNLRWSFPAPDRTLHEIKGPEELAAFGRAVLKEAADLEQAAREQGVENEIIEAGLLHFHDAPPFRYEFGFNVPAWNLRRETRAQAEERIMKVLRAQVREQLRGHAAGAHKWGLEKHPRKLEFKHFQWLAMHQVKGMSRDKVTSEVKKTWMPANRNLEHLSKTVDYGIVDAAKLVAGPSFESWLRSSRGRRR